MIRSQAKDGQVKVTFALPLEEAPDGASVVGDFNDWDPHAHPMRKRRNQTRSVAVELPPGESFEFRYLLDGSEWRNEPQADLRGENSLLAT